MGSAESSPACIRSDLTAGRHGKRVSTLKTSIAFEGQPPDYRFDFRVPKS
jgi:hypothetical protein